MLLPRNFRRMLAEHPGLRRAEYLGHRQANPYWFNPRPELEPAERYDFTPLGAAYAVRCAALEGLAQLGAATVVPAAISALTDESWQVRGSAIHALSKVRRKESIGPLIDQMAREQGRLIVDCGQALAEITGRDFGQRVDAW